MKRKTLHAVHTCGIHHVVYFFDILFMHFLFGFYMLFIYIQYVSHTHVRSKWRSKKWRPEKLKMVKKHFFPELSRDRWGVICYHHWYPRAGLEGREKSDFSKKQKNGVKNYAELPPEYFPCGGSA